MNARRLSTVCLTGCLAAGIASNAKAQFSSDPANQLQIGSDAQNIVSRVRANPLGGYYVSWQGLQSSGGNTYVQRLDANGNPLWTTGGIQVTDAQNNGSFEDYGMAVDASGSVLIAFRDNHTGSIKVGLQKILPDGSMPWGTNGALLASLAGSTDVPHTPGVIVTSDGNYAVRFTQGTTTNTATSRALYQKVDTNGNSLWNGGQPIVVAPATNGYTAADMVPGDNGNVIAAMFTTGSFTVSRRVVVQKLDSATGAQLWNSGTPVIVQTAGSLQIGNFPCVVSDGNNGVVIGWYTSSPLQCFVQRLNTSGAALFAAGGTVPTSNSNVRVNPSVAFDPASSLTYMSYTEEDSLQDQHGLFAQVFDASGSPLVSGGIQVLPVVTFSVSTVQNSRIALTTGGAIASWQEGTDPSGSTNMYIRAGKITSAGGLGWATPVTMVNSDNSTADGRIDTVSVPGGGVVDVYGHGSGTWIIDASRINDDGSLGAPATGSCCTSNTCTITSQGDCTGTWSSGGTCPASCGQFCGSADFNCDGDVGTDADIESFFACLAGTCPPLPCISNADFNGDGDVGTDADIEAFFRVLAGSSC